MQVDTSVWSLALRRAKRVDDTTTRELGELIQEGRVVLMGAVRQELLSGIKEKAQFEDRDFEQYAKVLDLELHSPRQWRRRQLVEAP